MGICCMAKETPNGGSVSTRYRWVGREMGEVQKGGDVWDHD